MKDKPDQRPSIEELLASARQAPRSASSESVPHLAESVLRALRTQPLSSQGAASTEPIADWLRASKWAAALACAIALAVVAFAPRPAIPDDQPNVLSALGGW